MWSTIIIIVRIGYLIFDHSRKVLMLTYIKTDFSYFFLVLFFLSCLFSNRLNISDLDEWRKNKKRKKILFEFAIDTVNISNIDGEEKTINELQFLMTESVLNTLSLILIFNAEKTFFFFFSWK